MTDRQALEAGALSGYVPPNVDQARCCRGDDLRHEAVSERPIAYVDGHACVDCCACVDCGAYRAGQYRDDPSAWELEPRRPPPGALSRTFTYRCWQSPESADAELWRRSGSSVEVWDVPGLPFDAGDVGWMYRATFADGFAGDVFAGELEADA